METDPIEPDALQHALLDAVELFRELKIGYAFVGGLAAMVYGRARYTEDVDFVAQPNHEATLADHPDAMKRHRFDPSCTYTIYHDSGIQIDPWKDEHAAGIVERRVRRKVGGRFVHVAEPHDLIAMKLRADRPQDDYDFSEIVRDQAIELASVKVRVTAAQFRRFEPICRQIGRA